VFSKIFAAIDSRISSLDPSVTTRRREALNLGVTPAIEPAISDDP
jgi:hypothetical protein